MPIIDHAHPFVLLEDRLGTDSALLYTKPQEIVAGYRLDDLDQAFARIQAGLARGLHAAGFFSYELGCAFEPHLKGFVPEYPHVPLLWFGLFGPPQTLDSTALDAEFAAFPPPAPLKGLSMGHDRATHIEKVRRIQDYLHAGDAYQVNLTFGIEFEHSDPLALYAAMRARQPVAHGGVMDMLYRLATQQSVSAPRTWELGNTAINRLLWTPGALTLVGWSDTRHLDGEQRDEFGV